MTKFLGLCAGAALAMSLVSARPAAAEELKLATLAPSGSPWMEVLEKAAAEVKEKTSGRVTIRYFPGGSQGDERDFVRKIKLGQLDGAAVTSIGLSMIDESIRVLELPMLFASAEEVDYVADKVWAHFQKKFEGKGFRLNDRGEVGWIYFLSKNKVESLGDLKGQKIWQWGDDALVGAMFKKLGLNGVPLGVPEVDASLTSGRIDAAYGSPVAAVALQWYTKVKFMTTMPMSFAIGATVVSMESLKKLSPEDQKIVEEIGRSAAKKLRKVIRAANETAKSTMTKKGVTVVATPAGMVDEFSKNALAVHGELTGKVFQKSDLDMVMKFRDEFRKGGGK
ncbi:MAG: TRAP transporter substrate-binding protein DctP [Deltaproteobacteria bacterium]|nr:TRAP transporter substrate-binding protein DctP [Deltaproteobacteria bacterium]MCW5808046.1 TRAP transporter substrate-binding protein DctP [Deltaproteobacteria bacterium]